MPYHQINPDIYHQELMLPFINLVRDIRPLRRSKLGGLSGVRSAMDNLIPIFAGGFMIAILGWALISGIFGL